MKVAGTVAEDLKVQLGLPMLSMSGDESCFFKQHCQTHKNLGIMTREIDLVGQTR